MEPEPKVKFLILYGMVAMQANSYIPQRALAFSQGFSLFLTMLYYSCPILGTRISVRLFVRSFVRHAQGTPPGF